MTPRQLHISCDFLLLIPFLGLLLSLFLFTNSLDKDIVLLKQILAGWNQKPINILQDSYQKKCEEIGMINLVSYDWPGVDQGCYCSENVLILNGKCSEIQMRSGCKPIEEVTPYKAQKWKTRYICASSMKSKSYFELSKVKASEECLYKHKKCGVIDSVGNHLCVAENENCPISTISFLNTVDEQNVRIETSNKKEDGKIYTNFAIAEDKLCLNNIEREFSEKDYLLLKKHPETLLAGCGTYINHEGIAYDYNKNFDKIDSLFSLINAPNWDLYNT